jgi:light-regulated signal transduction histidine kinase (bacteriophytochrome)
MYGLQSYADVAHRFESELADSGMPLAPEQRDQLVALWKEAMARVAPLLGAERREMIEIERDEGLSALRQVVHGLGGTIDVESTPGHGTTFRFSRRDDRSADCPSGGRDRGARRTGRRAGERCR